MLVGLVERAAVRSSPASGSAATVGSQPELLKPLKHLGLVADRNQHRRGRHAPSMAADARFRRLEQCDLFATAQLPSPRRIARRSRRTDGSFEPASARLRRGVAAAPA